MFGSAMPSWNNRSGNALPKSIVLIDSVVSAPGGLGALCSLVAPVLQIPVRIEDRCRFSIPFLQSPRRAPPRRPPALPPPPWGARAPPRLVVHPRRERQPDGERQPLPFGPRGILDAGGRAEFRMALEAAVDLAERHEFVDGEEAALREGRIPDGARVAFAQYEPVAVRPLGFLRIDAEDLEVQRGDDVARGHRAARMAALGVVRHPDDVLPEGHGLLLEAPDELLGNIDHDPPPPRLPTERWRAIIKGFVAPLGRASHAGATPTKWRPRAIS